MKIKVTSDHITRGRPLTGCLCPVALAVKEQTGAKYVRVGLNTASIGKHVLDNIVYVLPPEVEKFIFNFDGLRDVSPFEFELKDTFKETEW